MVNRTSQHANRRVVKPKESALDALVSSVKERDTVLGEAFREAVEAWRERGLKQAARKRQRQANALGRRRAFAGY